MFELFRSFFETGRSSAAQYPESLLTFAIERAVDGTDPRLRALPGYARKLKGAVIHAIDHVITLVEELPPAVDASRGAFGEDRRLSGYFPTADRLQEVLSAGGVLGDFVQRTAGIGTDRIVSLMMMEKHERTVLGVEQKGDMVVYDVPQVTVGFTNHRLVDPADAEAETRRLLKRRAFDHLLGIALGRIETAGKARAGLEQQCKLLGRKLKTLEAGGWTFEPGGSGKAADLPKLEAQLEEIQKQLRELGSDTGTLKFHLDTLNDVLGRAEEQLWTTHPSLVIDRKGIRREQASGDAIELQLDELNNADGRRAVALLLSVPRGEIRTRGALLSEAQRYL
ncbi:MAG: hypothetical protein R3F45_14165 [Gammaproteobacteria bacterium]